jgi:hypothetical protein
MRSSSGACTEGWSGLVGHPNLNGKACRRSGLSLRLWPRLAADRPAVCKYLCQLPPRILHISDRPAVHPAHVGAAQADPYRLQTVCYKIKSRTYTQGEGRWELFQKMRP